MSYRGALLAGITAAKKVVPTWWKQPQLPKKSQYIHLALMDILYLARSARMCFAKQKNENIFKEVGGTVYFLKLKFCDWSYI